MYILFNEYCVISVEKASFRIYALEQVHKSKAACVGSNETATEMETG